MFEEYTFRMRRFYKEHRYTTISAIINISLVIIFGIINPYPINTVLSIVLAGVLIYLTYRMERSINNFASTMQNGGSSTVFMRGGISDTDDFKPLIIKKTIDEEKKKKKYYDDLNNFK